MRAATFAAVLAAAATARADTPRSPTTSVVRASPAGDEPTGFALGLELGEPTSATAAWFSRTFAVMAALGSGTLAGPGLSMHADAQLVIARLRSDLPLRIGLGGRYYHHGYHPMSFDEIADSHYGIRGSVAIALERRSFELYAELAPGVDVKRTASCTLLDGPASICPHAQERPLFVQLVIGARWFISQ